MAAPDKLLLLWLLMYMLPESTRFGVRRGLQLDKLALEAEASVLRRQGVLSSSSSSARRRRCSLGSRFRLMRLCMVTIVLLEEDCSGVATPRPARSEPRRNTVPRDSLESSLPNRRVEEELSAPTRRPVPQPCSRFRPRDISRNTEQRLLLPSSDDWLPRPEVRRVLSRCSACG